MWRAAKPVKDRPAPLGLRVLLLEDDEADAYLARTCLGRIASVETVVRAATGAAALKLLQAPGARFDLALVDIHMPVMNGFDFMAAHVEAGLSPLPMVIFTSSAAESDRIRSRSGGAIAVITKPAGTEAFEQVLRTVVAAYATRVEPELVEGRPSWFEAVQAFRDSPGGLAGALASVS